MIKQKIYYNSSLSAYRLGEGLKYYINPNTVIVCIGTDKCIGDSLGPFVGSFLKSNLFPLPLYGTISSPIHALNMNTSLNEINKKHPNASIIGIDACLGDLNSIGEIHLRDSALCPGKGVGKSLPKVGSTSIVGIIDCNDNSNYFSSRSIRLSMVIDMAKIISKGIIYSYLFNNNIDIFL